MSDQRLLYVMDPMCSWCYAFRNALNELQQRFELPVQWVMGGLAPDSDEPMPDNMRETLAGYWHTIEEKTGTRFNHEYWQVATPKRSTYPACRAVVATQLLAPERARAMVEAIQNAYYLNAKSPSELETLVDCATDIGLDAAEFLKQLQSEETEQLFQQHMGIAQQLQVQGFPSLFLVDNQNRAIQIAAGYIAIPQLVANMERALQQ